MLRFHDLTDAQRRVVIQLAEADLADPPAWVEMNLWKPTVRKLTNLDLIVASKGHDGTRYRITHRGINFYKSRILDKKPRTRFSKAELKQIISRAAAGDSHRTIARDFGCTHSYVSLIMRGELPRARKIMKEMNMQPMCHWERTPPEVIDQLITMRQQGASYDEIKDKLGLSHSTIAYHLRKQDMLRQSPDHNLILRLTMAGYSQPKIAEIIGCSIGPVRRIQAAFARGEITLDEPASIGNNHEYHP